MKKRVLLGSLTIMAAIPSLAFTLFFTIIYKEPVTHYLVIEKMIIIASCVIGGLLLWRGKAWGYGLSVIGWLVILYESITGIYTAFLPGTSVDSQAAMFYYHSLIVAIGIPIFAILVMNIIGRNKA